MNVKNIHFPMLLLFGALLLVSIHGCVDDIEPPTPTDLDDPALETPLDAPMAIVGDGRITLDWDALVGPVISYRLYRDEGEGSIEELLVDLTATNWTDNTVINGFLYRYRVAAYFGSGVEGPRSDQTWARPAVFSVSINSDQVATVDREVSVRCGAPAGTAWMRLGADGDLSAVSWRPFAAVSDWLLVGEDGVHAVHAEFRDAYDNRSVQVFDEILLDSQAYIENFRFETWNLSGSDLIKVLFFLLPAESGGEAWAEVEDLVDVPLFLGGSGDTLTGTWFAEEVPDTVQAYVYGHFRDPYGNEAYPFLAPEILTLLP